MTRRSTATPTSSPIFRFRRCARQIRKPGSAILQHLMQGFGDPYSLLPQGTQANIEILSDALRKAHGATGFFNVEPDPDGVVRHSLLVLPYGRSKNLDDWDLYGSLDVQAVRLFQGLPDQQMVLDFSETGITALEFGPSLVIHPDAIGRMMIDYEGGVATYPYVSIADVVKPQILRREPSRGKLCWWARRRRESAICARRRLAESIIRASKSTRT